MIPHCRCYCQFPENIRSNKQKNKQNWVASIKPINKNIMSADSIKLKGKIYFKKTISIFFKKIQINRPV